MKIEDFIASAKTLGGICLRNQEIKDYKNGPKITLKKAYLEDGVLEVNKKYIIALVPEDTSFVYNNPTENIDPDDISSNPEEVARSQEQLDISQPLNPSTLQILLDYYFSDRKKSPNQDITKLYQQIVKAKIDYKSIVNYIEKYLGKALEEEAKWRSTNYAIITYGRNARYTQTGILRVLLRNVNLAFREIVEPGAK